MYRVQDAKDFVRSGIAVGVNIDRVAGVDGVQEILAQQLDRDDPMIRVSKNQAERRSAPLCGVEKTECSTPPILSIEAKARCQNTFL